MGFSNVITCREGVSKENLGSWFPFAGKRFLTSFSLLHLAEQSEKIHDLFVF